MYPNKEIKSKLDSIDSKILKGETLTEQEKEFRVQVKFFMRACEDMKLRYEISHFSIDESKILGFLNKSEHNLKNIVPTITSKRKLKEVAEMLERIDNAKNSDLSRIADYFACTYPVEHLDYDYVINSICNANGNEAFRSLFSTNWRTDITTINEPVLNVAKLVASGDYSLYNKIEKYQRLIKKDPSKLESILEDISQEYLDIDLKNIKDMVNGEISNDAIFTNNDILDFVAMFNDAMSGNFVFTHEEELYSFLSEILQQILIGKITPEDYESFDILDYYTDEESKGYFRSLLFRYKFDLDRVKKAALKEDLVSHTDFASEENLFIDSLGEINSSNIDMAFDYVFDDGSIYASVKSFDESGDIHSLDGLEELGDADLNSMKRIIYYLDSGSKNDTALQGGLFGLHILKTLSEYKKGMSFDNSIYYEEDATSKLL